MSSKSEKLLGCWPLSLHTSCCMLHVANGRVRAGLNQLLGKRLLIAHAPCRLWQRVWQGPAPRPCPPSSWARGSSMVQQKHVRQRRHHVLQTLQAPRMRRHALDQDRSNIHLLGWTPAPCRSSPRRAFASTPRCSRATRRPSGSPMPSLPHSSCSRYGASPVPCMPHVLPTIQLCPGKGLWPCGSEQTSRCDSLACSSAWVGEEGELSKPDPMLLTTNKVLVFHPCPLPLRPICIPCPLSR